MKSGPATLDAPGGIRLAALWDVPESPRAVAVLCHPHPLYGGTMQVPLLRTVAARLARAGAAVLRFNFRGVAGSTGAWGGGHHEVDDLAAAVEAALSGFPGLPLGLAGWSFGAVVALHWQARTGGRQRLVAIAPPTRPDIAPGLPAPSTLAPARRLFLVGSRDQFADAATLRFYAEAAGAEFRLLPGSDHFFLTRESRVGEAVATYLTAGP